MERSPYEYDPVAKQFVPRDRRKEAGGGMPVDPVSVGAAELGRVRPKPTGRTRMILGLCAGALALAWIVTLVFWSKNVDKDAVTRDALQLKLTVPLQ